MKKPLFNSARQTLARARRSRYGLSAIEVVMSTAVLVPLAGLLFFLGIDMSKYIYGLISTLVGWPYT